MLVTRSGLRKLMLGLSDGDVLSEGPLCAKSAEVSVEARLVVSCATAVAETSSEDTIARLRKDYKKCKVQGQ